MLNDIEIAQQAEMKNIKEVAAKLDIKEDDIEMYGKYKAKLSDELIASVQKNENGKLILVTAINPTPAGEGKTTITVGLGEAMGRLNKKAVITWSVLWYQRRCCRRRICTGSTDGGAESSFYW